MLLRKNGLANGPILVGVTAYMCAAHCRLFTPGVVALFEDDLDWFQLLLVRLNPTTVMIIHRFFRNIVLKGTNILMGQIQPNFT